MDPNVAFNETVLDGHGNLFAFARPLSATRQTRQQRPAGMKSLTEKEVVDLQSTCRALGAEIAP